MAALQVRRDQYPHVSDDQFTRLQVLLYAFVDIFSVDGSSFGRVAPEKEFYHRIPTGDARPVTQWVLAG